MGNRPFLSESTAPPDEGTWFDGEWYHQLDASIKIDGP
jgi:hypothetical protein